MGLVQFLGVYLHGSHEKPSTIVHVGTVVIEYTLQLLSARDLQNTFQSLSKLVKTIMLSPSMLMA